MEWFSLPEMIEFIICSKTSLHKCQVSSSSVCVCKHKIKRTLKRLQDMIVTVLKLKTLIGKSCAAKSCLSFVTFVYSAALIQVALSSWDLCVFGGLYQLYVGLSSVQYRWCSLPNILPRRSFVQSEQ